MWHASMILIFHRCATTLMKAAIDESVYSDSLLLNVTCSD